ncbi:MAG: UDP-glucose--hexose-1-phosphate uridylyltransferase, partial [Chloroflexi bacterium]|nr:UDP-glucose--hexose-1-phosphate uridylyltransferase [Chloroflexota bacterium]
MSTRTHTEVPHRRYNPLTGEWLLVSPQRARRPWLGAKEKVPQAGQPHYDPKCYLCPGNTRVNGDINPPYSGIYVFDNDFPAMLSGSAATRPAEGTSSGLLRASAESGVCRVICFSPRHDLTLAQLTMGEIRAVVDTWAAQCEELGARDDITYVQLFENRGEMMGSSNPHPHGQLWANEHLPTEPAKEQQHQLAYLTGEDRDSISTLRVQSPFPSRAPLLLDYLAIEQREGERIVFENEHFVCLAPFWAIWPFEVLLLPKDHIIRIVDMTPAQRDGLADALKRIATRYDNMFEISFPYSMGVHQAPYDGLPHEEWLLHLHFYPPLLRSATVKKFMVGYEMLAQPQRDLTAEQAAERLRDLS